jgi:hypothetical protein
LKEKTASLVKSDERKLQKNNHMKRFSEQLQKQADSIRLSVSEKNDLRERVVSYMEYHPLPLSLKEESAILGVRTTTVPVELVRIPLWRTLQWSAAVFGVFMFSVSYLAERAVPGDALYAIKVSVNEEVRGTLTRSPYEKVVWETERLNRRIAEARLLASEGRLTEEVEAEVALAVREHSDNARREIEILKETDKDEAALATIQLETTIEVQATALNGDMGGDVSESSSDTKTSLIASALAETQAEAHDAVASESETLPAYDRLTAHVEQETTRAYELLNNIHTLATPEEQSDIARRLEDINRSILEAGAKAETDEVVAREGLMAVLERTQRLIVFMSNIDIRSTVTVEEIVPVTLTIDERNDAIAVAVEETMRLVQLAESALEATTTPSELSEKLKPALATSYETASTTQSLLPANETNIETIELQIADALAVARDAVTALQLDEQTTLEPTSAETVVPSPETPTPVEESATTTATSSVEREPETELPPQPLPLEV